MIFDTHTHYDDEQFDSDRDELLGKMQEAGIETIVDVGASIETTKKALELAHKYDFIYAAVGVHPSEVEELTDDSIEQLRSLSRDSKCVAIGEGVVAKDQDQVKTWRDTVFIGSHQSNDLVQ